LKLFFEQEQLRKARFPNASKSYNFVGIESVSRIAAGVWGHRRLRDEVDVNDELKCNLSRMLRHRPQSA
jgi:hypothetical protein